MRNLALIGCGYWGKNYVNTLKDIDVRLSYVVETQKPSTKIPDETILTKDYTKVLKDKKVDGIMIVSPTESHYELASQAIRAGKNVLIEKPMTSNYDEAEKLYKMAQDKGVVLMVGHIFKYNDALQNVHQRILNGDMGTLRYIESRRIGLGPIRQDVDVVWDFATHDIYISNMLVGKQPTSVSGIGISHNGKHDDVASVTLRYENPNVLSTIYVNWEHPVKERQTIIGGDKKAILFDDVQPADKVKIFERGVDYFEKEAGLGSFQAITKQGDTLIPKIDMGAPLQNEIRHFISCIEGEKCISDGQDGKEVVQILELIDESRSKGGLEIRL